jgi:hypothetical protein
MSKWQMELHAARQFLHENSIEEIVIESNRFYSAPATQQHTHTYTAK